MHVTARKFRKKTMKKIYVYRALLVLMFCGSLPLDASAELTNCQKSFKLYLKASGHKAFATTLGNDPGYHPGSCSRITGYSIKKLAERKAVEDCNRNRRKIDGGKCTIIASE
jgi:hypothetical protein